MEILIFTPIRHCPFVKCRLLHLAQSTVKSEKLSSLRHPPPILGAFHYNEKNYFFIVIEQAISQ